MTNKSIIDHFPLLDSSNSHYTRPYCPYTFINRQSDVLVVTVGASWTWGNNMPVNFTQDITDVALHDYRIENLYGNLIAKQFNADFLNLAANGTSNFWAADRILDFLNLSDTLAYKKIYIIWTSTDAGKGFNSHEDIEIDYNQLFERIIKNHLTFDLLLEHVNQHALLKILSRIEDNKKIIFRIGSDMVDQIGFDNAQSYLLPTPWFYSLTQTAGLERKKCYIADQAAINRLTTALDDFIFDPNSQLLFKNWIMESIDNLVARRDSMDPYCRAKILFDQYHPTAEANRQWANVILNTL